MSVTVDEFGQVLPKWKEENTMPWGRLRYHSAWRNIAKHVEDRPLPWSSLIFSDILRLGHQAEFTCTERTKLRSNSRTHQTSGTQPDFRSQAALAHTYIGSKSFVPQVLCLDIKWAPTLLNTLWSGTGLTPVGH